MNQQTEKTEIALPSEFTDFQAQLAEIKKENDSLVFDYESSKGEKEARSHIAKLRKSKTAIGDIHKKAKAEVLLVTQTLDAGKRNLVADIDQMIEVHMEPIKVKVERKAKEKAEAEAKAQAEAEAKALAIRKELDHEAAILENERRTFEAEKAAAEQQRQAEIKADNDAAERIAADKAARIAAEKAEAEAEQRAVEAEQRAREAEQQAEQRAVEAAKRAKAQAEAEAEAKAQAEAQAEQQRLANIEYCRGINQAVMLTLAATGITEEQAKAITIMIAKGQVPNVKINY